MNIEGPIKSVIIKGKINKVLVYKLCPSTEFSEGVWNICLSGLGYTLRTNDYSEICKVSCNMIKSQKFNEDNYSVQIYEQPLAMFLLSSEKLKNTFSFGK